MSHYGRVPRAMTLRRAAAGVLLRHRRAYVASRRATAAARFLARRPHEPDFRFLARVPRRGLLVDVGANAGQSALSFRVVQPRSPILSLEPNPAHEPDLRLVRRLLRDFEYRMCAAGDSDGWMTLRVPEYRGLPLTGEGSLRAEAGGSSWCLEHYLGPEEAARVRWVEHRVPVRRLDGMAIEPAVLKVDVEGFELAVLRGALETLRRCRPIVLVERSEEFGEVSELLGGLGYEPYVYRAERDRVEPFADPRGVLNVLFLGEADRPRA
jgi:FkbM family methyltransferase